jgi:subtilisin family serine protease
VILVGTAGAEPAISPRVRMVLRGELPAGALSLSGDDRALVTVRFSGGAEALRQQGFAAWSLVGDLAAARLTRGELERLRAAGAITIEERRLLQTRLDRSTAAIGAPAARATTGLDGTGVLVGVVDTGIDWRHPDLRTADGHTRVAALLDLATPNDGRHPEVPNFGGAVYLRDEIDAALTAESLGMTPAVPVAERDTNGHGTHVAGIVASNGLATGMNLPAGRYVGVAPGADLIIAQATHGGNAFSDTDVVSACKFVLDRAQALGRPVVINLSLGGAGGAHDGSTNLEAALDALVPPEAVGQALVVAAGNAGNRDFHAGGWALDGTVSASVDVGSSGSDGQVVLELWTRDDPELALISPGGVRVGPVIAGHTLDSGPSEQDIALVGGRVLIDNGGAVRSDGRRHAGVVISAPRSGTWRIELSGKAGRWDAWVIDQGTPSARFVDHIDEDDRLEIPATAHNPIVVGSFVSRSTWTTVDGMAIDRQLVVGSPSTFSSSGPTSDGRFAPDLLAPGEFIVSSLSADAPPSASTSAFFNASATTFAWADDGRHGLLRGTSQAAPHVAGAAALLLQADPTLTAGRLREILRATANDGAFGARDGFGTLDVGRALAYARGARGGAVSATASQVSLSRDLLPPGEDTTIVSVTPRDAAGAPLGPSHDVAIALTAGAPAGPVRDLGAGRYERTFVAHASRGQVGEVRALVDGVALASRPTITFVADRSEVGRPFAATGGCGLVVDRPAIPVSAAALLLTVLFVCRLARAARRPRVAPAATR